MNLENKYEVLTGNGEVKLLTLNEILSDDKKTILYFYPKDNTPGCSLENKDFSCLKKDFEAKGIKLVGVSKDSIESHKKFKNNFMLENDLISDSDLVLHKELGAYGEKNNYGKIVLGVIRSTFLFDENKNLIKSWKGIKATGHALRVLNEI